MVIVRTPGAVTPGAGCTTVPTGALMYTAWIRDEGGRPFVVKVSEPACQGSSLEEAPKALPAGEYGLRINTSLSPAKLQDLGYKGKEAVEIYDRSGIHTSPIPVVFHANKTGVVSHGCPLVEEKYLDQLVAAVYQGDRVLYIREPESEADQAMLAKFSLPTSKEVATRGKPSVKKKPPVRNDNPDRKQGMILIIGALAIIAIAFLTRILLVKISEKKAEEFSASQPPKPTVVTTVVATPTQAFTQCQKNRADYDKLAQDTLDIVTDQFASGLGQVRSAVRNAGTVDLIYHQDNDWDCCCGSNSNDFTGTAKRDFSEGGITTIKDAIANAFGLKKSQMDAVILNPPVCKIVIPNK